MDKDKLIDILIKEKGGTREQYLSLLNTIAYHESGGTLDPTVKQFGGGPGRGKYQFEVGKDEGGITAARRAVNYLKKKNEEIPAWLDEAVNQDSLDASQLTSDQQDFLFLADKRMHPKADYAKLWKGEESVEDFWADYHWSGTSGKREERITSFKSSMERAGQLAKIPTQPKKYETQYYTPQTQAQDNTAVATQDQSRQELKPAQGYDYSGLFEHISKQSQGSTEKFNEFNAGGKHEQNPNGGVPIGVGGNGQMNTVEQGETSFDFGDDKFIFSDRISLTDYVKQRQTNSNTFAYGGKLNGGDPPADIKKHKPQPLLEKAWDVITNPMTALEHLTKTGEIPDNLDVAVRRGQGKRNNLDMAIDVINPLATARNIANIPEDLRRKEYLSAAGSALDVLPMGSVAKKALNKKMFNNLPELPMQHTGKMNTIKPPSKTPETSKFESEIDWAKWNVDIPGNKSLLDEYTGIEKAAKESGSWMKNADGSDFTGTPEQFVQIQSKNFKKAYPNGHETVYRGASMHNPELVQDYGNFKSVFTADKGLAQEYAANMKVGHPGDVNYFTPTSLTDHVSHNSVYELATNPPKHDIYMGGTDWTNLNFEGIEKHADNLSYNLGKQKEFKATRKRWGEKDPGQDAILERTQRYFDELEAGKFAKAEDIKYLKDIFKGDSSTDNLAKYIDDNNLSNIKLSNVLDGGVGDVTIARHTIGSYLKSLRGNNGMFDMSNPNIYKVLIPGILGGMTLSENKVKPRNKK